MIRYDPRGVIYGVKPKNLSRVFSKNPKVEREEVEQVDTTHHMVACLLNPKWYVERPGKVAPIDYPEVNTKTIVN